MSAPTKNKVRIDFKPKFVNTPPAHRPPIILDAAGGVFVLVVIVGAALSLFFLPGAR